MIYCGSLNEDQKRRTVILSPQTDSGETQTTIKREKSLIVYSGNINKANNLRFCRLLKEDEKIKNSYFISANRLLRNADPKYDGERYIDVKS